VDERAVMKLCGQCRKKPWPYLIAMGIAVFVAFLTSLTLGVSGIAPDANRLWTAGVFVGVIALLLGYMVVCMRRHCREDHHST
jgi:cytosine/uracil/thiamine/allantoin permease